MKTRELTGMNVTELTASTPELLFRKLAKFSRGRTIACLELDYLEFPRIEGEPEAVMVVWY